MNVSINKRSRDEARKISLFRLPTSSLSQFRFVAKSILGVLSSENVGINDAACDDGIRLPG
jgi:hypothetical protein